MKEFGEEEESYFGLILHKISLKYLKPHNFGQFSQAYHFYLPNTLFYISLNYQLI